MSLRKQRILKASLFIFIVLVLFLYSLFMFIPRTLKGSEATRFYRGKGYQDEEKNSLDVVMIGTSDAFSCFSPDYMYEKYGIRSYNCGVSKQSCVGMKRQLKELLKYQKPKVVIVETDAIYYRNLSDTAYVAEKFCDFVGKYHCFWKDMEAENLYQIPDYPRDALKGFIFRKRVQIPTLTDYMGDPNSEPENFKKGIKSQLDQVVEMCKEKDIEVFFYTSFSSATWNYARHNAVVNYTQSVGVDYYDAEDYREEIGFDGTTDYYDVRDNGGGDHLNISGAEKTTDFLAKLLMDKYGITKSEENEIADKMWIEDLVYYHELYDKDEENLN
ncbi:MAG: hypothetical protein J6Y28_08245 [Acholeplasmatales bacterium]|nr:hypothetical protein [Acholeplasmatales bacterium]